MRRITTGVQGGPILGKFTAEDNILKTIESNADIRLTPNGSGKISSDADITINSASVVYSNGSNTVTLSAPAAFPSSNVELFLPDNTGTSGYVLSTDGSGNLTWIQAVVDLDNQEADTSTYYPTMTTSSGSTIGGLSTSRSFLSFQPSAQRLTVQNVTVTGTMQAGTITETSSIAYKENINPIENALNAILQLAGKIYDRKDGSAKNEAGLIAEDVAEVIPNIVNYRDEKPDSIMYSRLTAYLVEAVKDLKNEIDTLKE